MTREIKLTEIDDFLGGTIQELVRKTTLKWDALTNLATPVVTDNLRGSWQTDIGKYKGTITTNVEYAEPVIYGTSLPPSWQGQFRTRQQTIKGFPELQAKQLTSQYIPNELKKINRRG